MGRCLGIDFGTRRIGVAISDESATIAFPAGIIENTGPAQAVEAVGRTAREKGAGTIVVGMPLGLNGAKGMAAENVERFIERLKESLALPVVAWDERLTTKIAERAMIAGGLRRSRRKECIDSATAQIILQSYLDARSLQKGS